MKISNPYDDYDVRDEVYDDAAAEAEAERLDALMERAKEDYYAAKFGE